MSDRKKEYVVLKVIDGPEGIMATYAPQVATIGEYESFEQAATFNVGSHPDADKRGRPYRVVVIPAESWLEFEVFSESSHGKRSFAAYVSEHPTMRRPNG